MISQICPTGIFSFYTNGKNVTNLKWAYGPRVGQYCSTWFRQKTLSFYSSGILRSSHRQHSHGIRLGNTAIGGLVFWNLLILFSVYQFLVDQVQNNEFLRDNLQCQLLIMEAMKYHLLPERRLSMQSSLTKPRNSTVGVLYAVGGMDSAKGCLPISYFISFFFMSPSHAHLWEALYMFERPDLYVTWPIAIPTDFNMNCSVVTLFLFECGTTHLAL